MGTAVTPAVPIGGEGDRRIPLGTERALTCAWRPLWPRVSAAASRRQATAGPSAH